MNDYPQEQFPVGRTSATERDAITSDEFFFWLTEDVIVNPFDIVAVDQVNKHGEPESRTIGIVTTLEHRTDAHGHLDNYVSSNFGQLDETPNTTRMGATVATVSVLSNTHGVYMPVPTDRIVCFAKDTEIQQALGLDEIDDKNAIPAGLIELTNGTSAVIYLDLLYMLGPEGAHVTVTGKSGLAAKTSYIMFLLNAIRQSAPLPEEIAVIILNLKHADLLQIDKPNLGLSEDAKAKWGALGLEPKPFENVHYFLPRGSNGKASSYPPIPTQHTLYAYDLKGAADKLDLLFSGAVDTHGTIESICNEISSGIQNQKDESEFRDIRGWKDLQAFFKKQQQTSKAWHGTIQGRSIGLFNRHLNRILNKQSGIFTESRSGNEKLLSEVLADIQGGSVYVVDASASALQGAAEQTLVFGDILRTVEEQKASNPLYPKKVIIFVDELNKYAPSMGKDSPITTQVLEIAERGRDSGVILLSAEQFMSQVHERVVENCSTKVIGKSGGAEVTRPVYNELGSQEVRSQATRLAKGEMLISHPHFLHPVKVKFPREAYQQPKG